MERGAWAAVAGRVRIAAGSASRAGASCTEGQRKLGHAGHKSCPGIRSDHRQAANVGAADGAATKAERRTYTGTAGQTALGRVLRCTTECTRQCGHERRPAA